MAVWSLTVEGEAYINMLCYNPVKCASLLNKMQGKMTNIHSLHDLVVKIVNFYEIQQIQRDVLQS